MYIIEKHGSYPHGVFWMGNNLSEAKKKVEEYASNDSDGYHRWTVSEFKEIATSASTGDAYHKLVYEVWKTVNLPIRVTLEPQQKTTKNFEG